MHNQNGWDRHIYDIYAAKASQPINSNTKVREQYVYLGSQLNGTICEHNVQNVIACMPVPGTPTYI